MNRTATLCLAAACLMSAGSAAQASPTPAFSWSYQFVPGGNVNGSGVTLTDTGAGHYTTQSLPAQTNLTISTPVYSSSFDQSSANPQAVSVPFVANLMFTDKSSGLTPIFSFSGTLSGNIWGSNNSTLSAHITSALSQSMDVNEHVYKVTYKSFTPPTDGHAGSLNFSVTVHHNPEPSTLVLAVIGAPFFGWRLRRRRLA